MSYPLFMATEICGALAATSTGTRSMSLRPCSSRTESVRLCHPGLGKLRVHVPLVLQSRFQPSSHSQRYSMRAMSYAESSVPVASKRVFAPGTMSSSWVMLATGGRPVTLCTVENLRPSSVAGSHASRRAVRVPWLANGSETSRVDG